MMINRKMMARKCGLSYDLLRYYEKSLANILSLQKGSNNQVLFDDDAQAIIIEAIALKKTNGYSMKQLFHHFNGTSRLDGKVVDEDGRTLNKNTEKNKFNSHGTAMENDINDAVFKKTAREDNDIYATNSHIPSDSNLPVQAEPATTALSVQEINSIIGDQVVSAVESENFMNALGNNIGNQVALALSSHLQHYDNNLVLMARTMQQISEQSNSICKTNSSLAQENLRLQAECDSLSSRMTTIEESVAAQEEKAVGNRFWKWFFGVKKKDARSNDKSIENKMKQSESFGNYFRRFLKDPVPPDKDAARHINSVGTFSRSTSS